jgi:hypothetical protein
MYLYKARVQKFSKKYRSHLKNLGSIKTTRSKFTTEDPLLGTIVKILVATATWKARKTCLVQTPLA